jgi:acyl-CoA reductase-like NAD-dependent aldehyde dehydrogenase
MTKIATRAKQYDLYIDGRWTAGTGTEVISVVNPATEEEIGSAPMGSVADTVHSIEAARRAFDEGPWPRMSPRQRSEVLIRMAEGLEKRCDELVALSIAEAGSTRAVAGSLQVAIPVELFADLAQRVLQRFDFETPLPPSTGSGLSQGVALREPGRQVNIQAADTFKRVVLELGGESANIICADADLDKVIGDVVRGFTLHAGQGCALLTRTLVHKSRHDELVAKIQAELAHLMVGDPAAEDTAMGPLIRETQRTKVEGFIDRARHDGAQVAYGGKRPAHLDKGYFLEPTLLVGVDNSMEIVREEVFGPVGVIVSFDDEDEAVRIANDSNFGLSGGVWSADSANAYAIARRLRTGTVSVNGGAGGINPDAPFGGYKHSGLGREFGAHGIQEFLEHKAVTWPVATG